MNNLCECPVCKGTGKYKLPHKMKVDSMEIKKEIAFKLRERGYSIRQIMVALGYKSPLSIQLFLKKN